MDQSVRAIVFEEPNRVGLRELTLPRMRDDHVLVRTRYSFVSPGTELRVLAGHYGAGGNFPLVPGYACVGTIEAVGSQADGYRVGDLITYTPDCMEGSVPVEVASQWGGHVSRHLVPVAMRPVVLPPNGDPLAYAVAQVAAISYRGTWIAQPEAGETAVVIGQGVVGAFNAAWLQLAGGRVIVVDQEEARLQRALSNGAAAAVNASDPDLLERIRALCPADGADIVVESAGVTPAVELAHQLVRRTPRAFRDTLRTVVGRWPRLVYQANYIEPVSVNPWTYFDGEGVVVLTPMDRNGEDQQRVVEAIRRGEIDARSYIDRVVPVAEAATHYADLRERKGEVFSVVFDWDGEQ